MDNTSKSNIRCLLLALIVLVAFCVASVTANKVEDDLNRMEYIVDFDRSEPEVDDNNSLDKRLNRYDFGLGKKSYIYTPDLSGKRAPPYNFGLGKRTVFLPIPLGKRSNALDEYLAFNGNYEVWPYGGGLSYPEHYDDVKRGRQYGFGLGRRSTQDRYNFGLGRR